MMAAQGDMRLRAFPMTVDETYMQNILILLQGEFNHLLGNSDGVDLGHEESYRQAYTMVLHNYGEPLYTCLKETVTAHLKSKANSLLLVTQNDFLPTFNQIWNNHQVSMDNIRDILMYMERVYVTQNNVANVIDLGRQIFRDEIYGYSGMQEKLREALLDLVRQERNGEVVDSLAIKNACQMLKDLGLDDRSIYETDFEQPFLQQTAQFYEIDIQNYSTENRAARCIKHLKTRMTEEYERAKNLFDDITVARVVAVFEQVLMKNLKDTLLDIAIPERKMIGLNSPCTDEEEFELPFLQQSAELYEFEIRNLSTENVVSRCMERVKSRLIELYTRAKNCLNECTEVRTVAAVEKELVEKLRDTIIKTIMIERNGEDVDCLTTKNVIQILIILGLDDFPLYNGVVELSVDFRKEIQNYLAENSAFKCIGMLKQQRIALSKWAKYYLNENTETEIVANIEAELKKQMKANFEMKISGITQSLKCRRSEELDLDWMYNLFSSCVRDVSKSDVNEPQQDVGVNCAITFIQNLMDLKQRVDLCSINLFQSDEISKQILKVVHDFGFLQLMNGIQNVPEYLALFIDDKIKKGVKEVAEQENDALLDGTIFLFKFLLEKDLFECYYRKHLAKRLLFNKTVSDKTDANEEYIISQLKLECGHEYTAKLEGMIQDIAISDTHMKEFRELGDSLGGVDLNVRVLTTIFWPIPSATPCCVMPHLPMTAYEAFKSFYLTKHNGRTLTLKPQLGSAELSATFLNTREETKGVDEVLPFTSTSDVSQLPSGRSNVSRKYLIVVSTYQMCILLMFNNRNELTYEEIKNETGMSDADLIRDLQSLAMGETSQRILIKHPLTKEIESSDVFSVNDKFSSKSYRIKIQTVKIKRDSQPERKEIRQKVEEGRKYEIEAAIGRIMKARQKLSHNDLVVELKEQLKSRFLPEPAEVKKRIEGLIQRDYLARTTEDRNVYMYVA